jgi:hypothetical protein
MKDSILWDGESDICAGQWCKIFYSTEEGHCVWFVAFCCGHDSTNNPVFEFFSNNNFEDPEFLYDSWRPEALRNSAVFDIATLPEVKEIMKGV